MATRFVAPDAEAKYIWLKTVLDTYYISDVKAEEHLQQLAKKGITLACHKSCHACCLNATVPFTEPELTVISWYTSEVLSGELREQVRLRLIEHDERLECPFLVNKLCSIYPVRPLSCRQFLVKTQECLVGEDVAKTRPHDIIPLPRETVIRPVAMRLLDHWKFRNQIEKQKAFESGFIVHNATNMHEFDWTIMATTMELFDNEAQPANKLHRK